MSEYFAAPRATATPYLPIEIALVTATTKTVLQVVTPSTTDIRVIGWGVSFDGVSGTGVPVPCQLIDATEVATVTALTPETWGNPNGAASLCVGGTALTGYNATVENVGTLTTSRVLDQQHVHPQSSYGVYFPEVRVQPRVAASRCLRIRCTAAAGVNVQPWILWSEPAILWTLTTIYPGRCGYRLLGWPAVPVDPHPDDASTEPGPFGPLGYRQRLAVTGKQHVGPPVVGLFTAVSPLDLAGRVGAVVVGALQGHPGRAFAEQFDDLAAERLSVMPWLPDGDTASTVLGVVAVGWPVAAAHHVMPEHVAVVVIADSVGQELLTGLLSSQAAARPGALRLVEQVVGADGSLGAAVATA